MEAQTPNQPVSNEASNYDEVFMHRSLLFDDSLKVFVNLYLVVETLKDYAVKALVNTVDHLGSVTYKVNNFLDEKVVKVSMAELWVSCIEQVYLIVYVAHLLSDVETFAISLFSLWAARWEANPHQSYGFFRIKILGALVSIQNDMVAC
ncbi:hypothetical protein RJT34_22921 [Clitoria ternatea]|uniref:Cation efflux protein transmembrane domain-containing protein n=1 Tax=Clitoria ternatea TaxID=43366 RepID=A0AAN9FJZ6_CLITE